MRGIHVRMKDNPTIDKLITLARGDVELFNKAMRATSKNGVSDLLDVVNYITECVSPNPTKDRTMVSDEEVEAGAYAITKLVYANGESTNVAIEDMARAALEAASQVRLRQQEGGENG